MPIVIEKYFNRTSTGREEVGEKNWYQLVECKKGKVRIQETVIDCIMKKSCVEFIMQFGDGTELEATAHDIGPITEKLGVRSAALLIAPLKHRAANTALGHHRDLPSGHSKGRFGMLKVSVFGVKKCFFFFLWHSQHPIDCSRRFLMRGSILKGSVKFGLTKHFSDQSGHGRFS